MTHIAYKTIKYFKNSEKAFQKIKQSLSVSTKKNFDKEYSRTFSSSVLSLYWFTIFGGHDRLVINYGFIS
jgi:hypothetical protein